MRPLRVGSAAALLILALTACGGTDAPPEEESSTSASPDGADVPADAEDDASEADPTDGADEDVDSGDAVAGLPTCESPEITDAADIILSQIEAPTLNASEYDGVTSCLWYGDPESLSVNVQHWSLGGDKPDETMIETLGIEPLDDPSLADRGLLVHVDVEFDGEWGSAIIWGHGYQVMVEVEYAGISLEDAINVGETLISAIS